MVWQKKDYKIGFLTTVAQVQVDKMTFTTAYAFLFTHFGLGMLQHGPDTHCMTVSVNSSTADLSAGLLLESVVRMAWQPNGASGPIPAAELWCSEAFKLCHVASSTPQRNPSHKRVLKASIRGSQRLAWDDCTYYGDSLNQQICKLQIPHQTMAICGNAGDQRSNESLWTRLNILQCALRTHFLASTPSCHSHHIQFELCFLPRFLLSCPSLPAAWGSCCPHCCSRRSDRAPLFEWWKRRRLKKTEATSFSS